MSFKESGVSHAYKWFNKQTNFTSYNFADLPGYHASVSPLSTIPSDLSVD